MVAQSGIVLQSIVVEGQVPFFNGLLLDDPLDVREIASKLDLLLGDVDLRTRLAEGGRRTAEQYSWDRVAERTAEVYRQILAHDGDLGPDVPDRPTTDGEGGDQHAA